MDFALTNVLILVKNRLFEQNTTIFIHIKR